MNAKKKVFIVVPPEIGHVNPISGLANGLVQRGVDVTFYGNQKTKQLIERTGASFRQYTHETFEKIDHSDAHKKKNMILNVLNHLLDFSYDLIPDLMQDVKKDQPDLIIYDTLFIPARYLVEVARVDRRITKKPDDLMFMPSFAMNEKILGRMPGARQKSFSSFLSFVGLFFRQLYFNLRFGTRIWHPMFYFIKPHQRLNIVAVFPELQPNREDFGPAFEFVGPCIPEQIRNYDITDAKLKAILDRFKPINPCHGASSPNESLKLVYFSLGTTFNDIIDVFESMFEAFKRFDDKTGRKIKLDQLNVIISLGDKVLEKFENKIKNENYRLPENLALFAKVPQIEILKRASLFITHAGQNSASETIQYGVPVICLPIAADQPLVSSRLCDDLKIGVRFNIGNLDVNQLRDAIEEVLTNRDYTTRVLELSKVSSKYNGVARSTELVMNYLNNTTGDKKSN